MRNAAANSKFSRIGGIAYIPTSDCLKTIKLNMRIISNVLKKKESKSLP